MVEIDERAVHRLDATVASDRDWRVGAEGGWIAAMRGYDANTYGDAFADVYDDWYADLGDVEAALDTICRLAGGPAEAATKAPDATLRVLELAVGTGRLAIPLATRGIEVHGIDASAAMLDRLRAKPGGDRVHVHLGDMATGLPDGPFGAVFVAYNSLFSLDLTGQRACVAAAAERLSPDGVFIVEAFVPDRDRPAGSTVGVRSISADRVVLSVDIHHPDSQRAEGQFVEITETGGVRLRPWSIRYSTIEEIDEAAAAAGLSLLVRHEDWAGSAFDEHSPRHVSVYTRRDTR